MTAPVLARPGTGRSQARLHRAWLVAGVTFLALVAAAAFRSSTGVLLEPVEQEFGWSRAETSSAVSLNLLLFGLTAPFAAALMERFGVRRVVVAALLLMAAGTGGTLAMTQAWQLILLWGLVVGLGSGSMALVFGAIIANRWFTARRGLVMGMFSAGSSTGQLVVLPVVAWLAVHVGWRAASAVTAGLALAMVPLVLAILRDRPADVGLLPYGAPPPAAPPAPPPVPPPAKVQVPEVAPIPLPERPPGPGRVALRELSRSARVPAFWVLAATFFVCGWSTNGLIQTHFIPAAHDHGLPATTAAGLLAAIGVFDILGTIGSGWLSDRVDPRYLLVVYYGLRGVSLLTVPALLGPRVQPSLLFFIVFYGLDWVATVPPTVALCREIFGIERAAVVFGWVFAAHMIGAGVGADVAGAVRQSTGSYSSAWWTAGVLCLVAGVAVLFARSGARVGPQRYPAASAASVPGGVTTASGPDPAGLHSA